MMTTTTTLQKPANHRGHRGTQRSKPSRCSLFTLRASAFSALKTVLLIMLLPLALFATTTHAEDYSNNIGFMKNPPRELKEKFPICDQFLDVKWIKQFPEGNWVGTVTADVYHYEKKRRLEIAVMHSKLEWRKGYSNYLLRFDVTGTPYKGDKLEKLILSADRAFTQYRNRGGDSTSLGFSVLKGNTLTIISKTFAGELLTGIPESLTNYTQNVCIPHPQKVAAYLIEDKRPFLRENLMTAADRAKLEQFKKIAAKECSRPNNEIERESSVKDICSLFGNGAESVRQSFTIQDVDGDGKLDYRSGHIVAFLNDKQPFFLTISKACFHPHYYYEPQEKLKEERCIADEKRRFLQNRNSSAQ